MNFKLTGVKYWKDSFKSLKHFDIVPYQKVVDLYLEVHKELKDTKEKSGWNERPINSESNRAYLLSGLSCVDLVIIFSEDTPLEAISAVNPDVLVKGDDYDSECSNPSNPEYIVGSNEIKKNVAS